MDPANSYPTDLESNFKLFHELMAKKIREILLVSSLYDFCIMEEDGRLSERIIHEYRGLNLSQPPRITWVSSAEEALAALDKKIFDMVITMPRLADMDAFSLGREIKLVYTSRKTKVEVERPGWIVRLASEGFGISFDRRSGIERRYDLDRRLGADRRKKKSPPSPDGKSR